MILLAWRNLFRNPRRTLASLFTVALGSCGLLIYQGFNEGIMNQYRENTIRVRYGHGQVFPKGYREQVKEKPWEDWIENAEQVESTLRAVPGVRQVFPRIAFTAFITRGGITLAGRGEGVVSERERNFFTAMNFEEGGDMSEPDQIILGKGLAHSLNAKVGDRVTILGQTVKGQLNGLDLTVAGIFHTGAKDYDDSYFRIDLGRTQSLLDTRRIEQFSIEADGVDAWPAIEREAERRLPALDAIPFQILDKVYYQNAVDFLATQFRFIRSIIVLVVALGIFNIVAVGLLERAPEVGALRANGESRNRLIRILLLENAFLGCLGGVIGIALAVLLNGTLMHNGIPMPPGPGITRQFMVFLEIQPRHYIQAVLLPLLTTVVASVLPINGLIKRTIPDLLKSK